MRNSLFFILFIFAQSLFCQSLKYEWAAQSGGRLAAQGRSVVADQSGNSYITGSFSDTIDFDPDTSVYNLLSNGGYDIFIQKLDVNGSLVWAKSIGGYSGDFGQDIALDAHGNVYVCGWFYDGIDADPDTTIYQLPSPDPGNNAFLLKLDSDGKFLWAKALGTRSFNLNEVDISLYIDLNGNPLVTGVFNDTVVLYPGDSTSQIVSQGYQDVFVLKLDSSGNHVWTKKLSSKANMLAFDIASDMSGNIMVTGAFSDSADFDPSLSNFYLASNGNSDIYLLKLSPNGAFLWAKSAGGSQKDQGRALTIDQKGSVYVTGFFYGQADFDPGVGVFLLNAIASNGAYIWKLDKNGNLEWAKCTKGGYATSSDISLDGLGNIYATGIFYSSVDFDPGLDTFYISGGFSGMFIQVLDTSGSFVIAKAVFASLSSLCANTVPSDVTQIGSVHLTGCFNNSVDFDPGPNSAMLTPIGIQDIFVLKLDQCLSDYFIDSVTACGSYYWHNKYYTSSNYRDRVEFVNAQYCDSTIYLKLTINKEFEMLDEVKSCDPYKWIDGNTYQYSTNVPMMVFKTNSGCDSIIRLRFTRPIVITAVLVEDSTLFATQNGAKYQWLDCENNYSEISGAKSRRYKPLRNGKYAVQITREGCIDTSRCIVFDKFATGIEGLSLLSRNISIYPNPVIDVVNIHTGDSKQFSLKVFDHLNKVVYANENLSGPDHQFNLKAPNGIYFFEVKRKNKSEFFKIVKN